MSNEASNGVMNLNSIRSEFQSVLQVVLENMYTMSHSKLLTYQLNFNGVYDKMGYKDTKSVYEYKKWQSSGGKKAVNKISCQKRSNVEVMARQYSEIHEEKMTEKMYKKMSISSNDQYLPTTLSNDEDKDATTVKKRKTEGTCNSDFVIDERKNSISTQTVPMETAENSSRSYEAIESDFQSLKLLLQETNNSQSKPGARSSSQLSSTSSTINKSKTAMYFSKHSDFLNRVTNLALKRRKRMDELSFHSASLTVPTKRQRST